MSDPLRWETDGRDWPLRADSRFVEAGGIRWHVQQHGSGPTVLLLHGTGASTHSWRGLAPLLAARYTVLAMDLPGHAFTQPLPPGTVSLSSITTALDELLRRLRARPELVVGHSAGAAIAARMVLDGTVEPRALVSINGAMLPLTGLPGAIFSPMARLLAANSLAARIFAWRAADPAAVERLVASTGSRIDAGGVELYGRLVRSRAHVAGTLHMMAGWDLEPMRSDLAGLDVPLLLLAGTADSTVPPSESERVARIVPTARLVRMAGPRSPGARGKPGRRGAAHRRVRERVAQGAEPETILRTLRTPSHTSSSTNGMLAPIATSGSTGAPPACSPLAA